MGGKTKALSAYCFAGKQLKMANGSAGARIKDGGPPIQDPQTRSPMTKDI